MDGDVLWCGRGGGRVNGFEEHRTLVLVEEFGGRVDVVVGAGVGAADYHYGVAGCVWGGGVVDAVVVDWGTEEVGVGFEPGEDIDILLACHQGTLLYVVLGGPGSGEGQKVMLRTDGEMVYHLGMLRAGGSIFFALSFSVLLSGVS